MEDYRRTLKRVGTVLVAVGLLDIGFMAYCIVKGQSYSSSFNVFAVIAGVFLMRGSLGAVRLVTFFSAFMFSGFLAALLVFPFLKPVSLWAAEFRVSPISFSLSLIIGVSAVALLYWIFIQLRQKSVIEARIKAGQTATTPRLAFALGVVLVVFLASVMLVMAGGASGRKAVDLARAEYGKEYSYHVTAMQWTNGHVSATLAAYNDDNLKQVIVKWDQ